MNVSRSLTVASVTALALVLGGCDPSPLPAITVTAAPTAAPTPAASVTPAPAGHVFTDGDQWDLVADDGAQGSGCSPGSGLLPDGAWFGFAKEWDSSSVAFDLACHYLGDKAVEVATARGEEAYDFYLTNDVTTVRVISVASDAFGHKAEYDAGVFSYADILADPGGIYPPANPIPVWIFVNGGVVTEVAVQFFP